MRSGPQRSAVRMVLANRATATVVGLLMAFAAPVLVTATADGPVVGGGPAVRGARRQEMPQPAPPSYGGCLFGSSRDTLDSVVGSGPTAWVKSKVVGVQYPWHVGFHPTAGTRGAIVVVGDSLTLGAIDLLMAKLIDLDYGPICVESLVGRFAVSSRPSTTTGIAAIERVRASDPVWALPNTTWVLALGTNDVTGASGDAVAFAAPRVAALRAAVGAIVVPVYWIDVRTLRSTTRRAEDGWNAVLASTGDVVVDWSGSVSATPGVHVRSTDLVHLTAAGNVLRADLVVWSLRRI